MTQFDELRARVDHLIDELRAIPDEKRTPAMRRLLYDLSLAADKYDKATDHPIENA